MHTYIPGQGLSGALRKAIFPFNMIKIDSIFSSPLSSQGKGCGRFLKDNFQSQFSYNIEHFLKGVKIASLFFSVDLKLSGKLN